MLAQVDENKLLEEIPSAQRRPIAKTIVEYEKSASSRNDAILLAYESGAYSMTDIGQYFGWHYSRISRIIFEQVVQLFKTLNDAGKNVINNVLDVIKEEVKVQK